MNTFVENIERLVKFHDRLTGQDQLPKDPLVAPTMNFDPVQTGGKGVLGGQQVQSTPHRDYGGQAAPASNANDVDGPLVAPTMSFDTPVHSAVGPTSNDQQGRAGQGEEPLLAPTMEF